MKTSSHINQDELQSLFDALPQPTVGSDFEQKTMRKVYLAAQQKLLAQERNRMRVSMLWATVAAACITAIIINGMYWINEQSQSIMQTLQEVNIAQTPQSFQKEFLWLLAVGAFIWLLSLPKKSYST